MQRGFLRNGIISFGVRLSHEQHPGDPPQQKLFFVRGMAHGLTSFELRYIIDDAALRIKGPDAYSPMPPGRSRPEAVIMHSADVRRKHPPKQPVIPAPSQNSSGDLSAVRLHAQGEMPLDAKHGFIPDSGHEVNIPAAVIRKRS